MGKSTWKKKNQKQSFRSLGNTTGISNTCADKYSHKLPVCLTHGFGKWTKYSVKMLLGHFCSTRNQYGLIRQIVGQLSRGKGEEEETEKGLARNEDEKTETQTRL